MVLVPNFSENVRLRGERNFVQNRNAPRVTAEMLDGGVSRGLASVAGGLSDMAQAVDFRDQVKAEADAREALNEYRTTLRSGLYDPQGGYMVQQGKNALDGARKDVHSNLEEARAAISGKLSPRAQKVFDQRADALDNSAKDSTIRHEGVELKNYTLQQFEASAQGYLDDAYLNFRDDAKFEASVSEAAREVAAASALAGDSPEVTDQKLGALRSTSHAGRVIEVARENPIAAFAYLKEKQDEMKPAEFNKLFTQLEPAYYNALARDWVSDKNVMVGDSDQYGVPSFISTPESGGDSNAKNSRSTATGRVQFLSGTYLNYVQKLQLEGGAQWANGMTKQQILDTRRDPAKEGEVYRAFRRDNANIIKGAGFAVTPQAEYMAHHMGPGTAVAMLRAAQTGGSGESMQDLLTRTVGAQRALETVAANPWMRGQTVGSAMDWFDRKTGGTAVTNPAIAARDALKIEDPKLRAAVLSEIKTRVAAEELARSEETRQANEAAWDIVDNGGSPDQIPPELQAQVGLTTMNEIFNAYQRNAIGVDVTNEGRYDQILEMATLDPRGFEELDLNKDRNNLSRADFRYLRTQQLEMLQQRQTINQNGAAALVYKPEDVGKHVKEGEGQFWAAIGAQKSKGTPEQLQQWHNFERQLRGTLRQFADQEGRQPTWDERANMISALTAPVVISGEGRGNLLGLGGDAGILADAANLRGGDSVELQYGINDVPYDEEVRIREEQEALFGRPLTEEEVVETFENELLLSYGVEPTVEFDEIASDVRRRLIEEYPGASEQQLVEVYLGLVLDAAKEDQQLRD